MRVEIGPVSGASATAWVVYGREVIEHVATTDGLTISENALHRFGQLLDEWQIAASPDIEFRWSAERSPEEVEFLMKALFEVGLLVEEEFEIGRMQLRPPAADEFHVVVVRQVLAHLESEGPSFAHFVDGLRGEWGIAARD